MSKPSRFGKVPPLWDGRAAARIVQALLDRSGASEEKLAKKNHQPLPC
jgi:hypothetical protein